MLRSIFSLIQNIIDSDKEYNNKKSQTVIYLTQNPDNTLNMDLEIDGKVRENIKALRELEEDSSGSFKITTEQGDTVTCKHYTNKQIKAKIVNKEDDKVKENFVVAVENVGERASFANAEEVKEEIYKPTELGDNRTTVKDFLDKLPDKQVKILDKDRDQISALMDQIQKMKKGMERLQEIAQQFNCSDKFKQDVEFLTKNVGPSLSKSKEENSHVEPKH